MLSIYTNVNCGLFLFVVTDVAWSVCLSVVHDCEPCKMAELVVVPFGVWTRVDPRNHVLGGAPDPPRERAIQWEAVGPHAGISVAVCFVSDRCFRCQWLLIVEIVSE